MKMEIRAHVYDGLPVFSAMGMAMFETSGLAAGLEEALGRSFDNRCLSPTNAVKAMLGPVFDGREKMALRNISTFYTDAPTDMLFGVDRISMHDSAFGRALDTLADLDHSETLWSLSAALESRYGLGSDTLHMDTTNLAVYALDRDYTGEPVVPTRPGKSKEERPDLLHYAFMAITDSDGIIRYLEPYNANLSDCDMNRRALQFLDGRVDASRTVIVADSKLATAGLVGSMRRKGFGFVTVCPEEFGSRAQARAKAEALAKGLRPSTHKEGKKSKWVFYDTDLTIDDGGDGLRFVVYRTRARYKRSFNGLKRSGERRISTLEGSLRAKKFDSEKAASAAAEAAIAKLDAPAYDVRYLVKPAYNNKHRHTGKWTVKILHDFNEDGCKAEAERRSLTVLATNLPRSDADHRNPREGATAEAVAAIYAGEFHVEHTFRLMKSGIGIDKVYLQTPSRERAMMFVVGLIALVSQLMDALLKRASMDTTVYSLSLRLHSTSVRCNRERSRMWIDGNQDSMDIAMGCLEVFEIEPERMLGPS